ncbi:MAG: Serine/threonine-protein kinase PknD [Planctomycetes bacterium]|nr:Serine/threonine-protein kinase PknD [Planctomycetota bacterium]
MGKVYAATAPDGTRVAVKVVHPHLVEQPGARERFLREALSGLSIASPNVVRTIECLETEVEGKRVPALVLEFVEGRDLAALLDETKRVPEDLCRFLAREVARGLEAIHAAGIVHRDMKPGNVLMTSAGEVKVMDLGLARQASGEDRMSQTGLFLGTAAYAPPEQFLGKKDLDPRSDLYSLGAMLFELATGRVPFRAEAIGDLVRQVLRDKAPRIGTLAPQTTPFFEEVVATLLEKEPDRRFPSAADLAEVLDQGEGGDWWAAAATRLQMSSRKPLRRVRVQQETELWGREDDLAELRGAWDRAKRGAGAVVLLEGEAGIGKTRLVEELLAAVDVEDEAQILVGRHDPAGGGSAAEALAAAFREHLGADDLDARLRELLPETPLLVPAFSALVRGTAAPDGAEPLSPAAVQTLFVRLTQALAAEAPLVLVVDDLHFATDEGRALFRAVALAVDASPVLVLGTARPGLPPKWVESVATRSHATRHEVRRLDKDTVRAALVRHLGGGVAAETVAEQLSSRAGGNPYFVVELLRLLGEQGCLARTADGRWGVTSMPQALILPETVRDLVAQRLASLGEADRDLLDACACQGHEFDGRLAAETLGRARMDVLRALGRLEHGTRLVRAAGTRFAFDHHVVHEVVYATMPDARREALHTAVADAVERQTGAMSKPPADVPGAVCAELAAHLLRGADKVRALRYLDPAFAHLERTFLNERAIEVAALALAAPGLLDALPRYDVLVRMANRLGLVSRGDAERAALEEALAIADASGDASRRSRVRTGLAGHFVRAARIADAEAMAVEAAEIALAAGDRSAESGAAGALGNVFAALGRFDDARIQFERRLALSKELGDRAGEAGATGNLGAVLSAAGRPAEALVWFERSRELAREAGDSRAATLAGSRLGGTLMFLGRYAEARDCLERGLALAREIGDRAAEVRISGTLGNLFDSLGRPSDALTQYERQAVQARAIGDRESEAVALVNLGPVRLATGDLAGARRDFADAVAICREIRHPYPEGYGLAGLAAVADEEGDAEEAVRLASESLALRRRIGHGIGVTDSLLRLARARRRAGDPDGARAAAAEAMALARTQDDSATTAICAALLAAAGAGDADEAEALLVAAGASLDVGHSMAARFDLWQASRRREHLAEAKRLLDDWVAHAAPECREAMLANVRLHRDITVACGSAGM